MPILKTLPHIAKLASAKLKLDLAVAKYLLTRDAAVEAINENFPRHLTTVDTDFRSAAQAIDKDLEATIDRHLDRFQRDGWLRLEAGLLTLHFRANGEAPSDAHRQEITILASPYKHKDVSR